VSVTLDDGPPAVRGLYLLHFTPRYRHAGHYLGFAESIAARVREHRSASPKSSPLVRAALGASCAVDLVRVWPGEGRTTERRLKRGGGLSRYCPVCRSSGRYHA
jgi:hypothetical protein